MSVMDRLRGAIGWGRVTTAPDDSGAVQTMQAQVDALRTFDKMPHVGLFGITSVPPVGSDVVVLFRDGDAGKGVIIASGNQTLRIRNLAPGEFAIWDAFGHSVKLQQSGVTVDAGGQTLRVINAPITRFEGAVQATGEVTANCDGAPIGLSTHRQTLVQTGTLDSGPPLAPS